ncbi:MAG: hypothetical protein ACLRSD_00215 [Oscillibacter sp.]
MNEKFSKLGFYPSDILLPKKDVDMSKWAVVACDQFTSEPEYWERVEKTVGDAPSTLPPHPARGQPEGPQRRRVHRRHQRLDEQVPRRGHLRDAQGLPHLHRARPERR